jgi:hypothetical protein
VSPPRNPISATIDSPKTTGNAVEKITAHRSIGCLTAHITRKVQPIIRTPPILTISLACKYDFASLQTGLAVPHGIYDLNNNQACINLGSSHDTAEFFFDSMVQWWESQGKHQYPKSY